jgi:hypothetical protein
VEVGEDDSVVETVILSDEVGLDVALTVDVLCSSVVENIGVEVDVLLDGACVKIEVDVPELMVVVVDVGEDEFVVEWLAGSEEEPEDAPISDVLVTVAIENVVVKVDVILDRACVGVRVAVGDNECVVVGVAGKDIVVELFVASDLDELWVEVVTDVPVIVVIAVVDDDVLV